MPNAPLLVPPVAALRDRDTDTVTSAQWDTGELYVRVYELLITCRERSVPELQRRVPDHSREQIIGALQTLRDREMVALIDPDREMWEALPPAQFINQRLHHLETELADERTNFTGMLEEYWKARSRTITSYAEVETIREVHETVRIFEHLQKHTRQQVRGMTRAPFIAPDEGDEESLALQNRLMASGVDYRVLYETDFFTHPVYGQQAYQSIAKGEQARTLTTLPMKLIISDDDTALVVLDPPSDPSEVVALLVRRSGLLNALIGVFESMWEVSTPLAGRTAQTLDRVDRTILTMMVGGSTDEAIGTAVGMSRRSVARRCATLFVRLGAANRFQAGAQAVRRGWL